MSFIANADRLIDRFIPPILLADREMRTRARMFLFSHMFGPILGNVIPACLFWLEPKSGTPLFVLAASITSFWAYPFALRYTGRYVLLSHLSIQNLLFAILWGCYFFGGASSPFLPWLVTVPLLAFFYLGASLRTCAIILLQIGLSLGGFATFYLVGGSFPQIIALPRLQGIGVISIISASTYVVMMALFYAKILASQAEVEAEVNKHLATSAELRAAALLAERAGVAKAAFLARMSHELRTPLNAVIGYSQLLLEETDAAEEAVAHSDLARINHAGRHLLHLVNAILDLSKIEAGRMDVFVEAIDFEGFVADLSTRWRDAEINPDVAISWRLSGADVEVRTDVAKVERIVNALVDNAVRYTKTGAIDILVDAEPLPGERGSQLSISVRDTGCGIAPENIPGLFETFAERDDATTSKFGSAGLGLPLSKRFCDLLKGELLVESELGVGSVFTIRLPNNPASALAALPQAA
jgi:signal transduction histidine kinase